MPGQEQRSTSLRPVSTPARGLVDLANRLDLVAGIGPLDGAVTGITHDSAAVLPGDLYAALPGTHTHGARFVGRAGAAGAVGVLTDEAGRAIAEAAGSLETPLLVVGDPRAELGAVASWIYGEPSHRLRVLGVTGTNGKTTTSYLLDAGLRAAGEKTGLVGTIETRIGEWVAPSARTTPEAPDLQALLAVMVERGASSVSMEVSSHALALHRVDGTAFEVVAFSNLSQDHLDFHADLDDYFNAKARLFTPQFARAGVVNVDDEHGRRLLDVAEIPLTTVSATTRDAQWSVSNVTRGRHANGGQGGTDFVVHGPDVVASVSIRLPGSFNVANALLAFVQLVVAGIDPQTAARGIADVLVVPGRMEAVSVSQPFTALVDYAHTPDAVVTLLTTLRPTTTGRLIVVLGCGGDRDRAKRPLMGAAAARLADVAVLTSDNPRSEEPEQILAAMLDGAMGVAPEQRGEVIVELDRLTAIQIAVSQARAGDVVVVAGKGHEQGQEVAGVVHPFDDRTVLRAELAALTNGAGTS